EIAGVGIFGRGILRRNPCVKRDSEQKYRRDNNCGFFHRCYSHLTILLLVSGSRFRVSGVEVGGSGVEGKRTATIHPSMVSAPRVPCFSLVTRPSSLNSRLLRKQQLDLEAELPIRSEFGLCHVAKRLELRVDREFRDRMTLEWQYLP